ncbi:hypothetical protein Tco_1093012 [Tanacetum coccineum]|uniref:Uncharacterized protein n=1 Tax=Tanacetum coccineum TaxID=301880 RepID=A0ABQ5IBH1_9ASTR
MNDYLIIWKKSEGNDNAERNGIYLYKRITDLKEYCSYVVKSFREERNVGKSNIGDSDNTGGGGKIFGGVIKACGGIEWLNEVSAAIKKYPEIILSVIGLSRWFVEEDVRPTFLRSNNSEMGLLDFVKSYDPFKAKDMVISPSRDAIHIVDHTVVDELKSVVGKKKRRVVFNDGLPHVKKAKGSSSVASPERNPTTDGKTPDESGSMQDKNVRSHPASKRFVIITSSSPSAELLNTDLSASLKFASLVLYIRKEAEATAAGLAHEAGASFAPGQEV